MEIPNIFKSSYDPEKIALTVKGAILMVIPVILIIAQAKHWNLGQSDLNGVADAVSNAVIGVLGAISSLMVAAGLIRKILVDIGWIKPKGV